jgi:hypothetical protein
VSAAGDGQGPADRAARRRAQDAPLWQQALVGIGYVAAGALCVVLLGVLLATVVAWVF